MGKLTYTALSSLDGYIADARGNFDWAGPKEDVHSYVNGLQKKVGTMLYGRAMYEILSAWEDIPDIDIGGANIASQALAMGLIDETYRFIFPVMIGSGKKWLECTGPVPFDLIGSREFSDGVLMVHYGDGTKRSPERYRRIPELPYLRTGLFVSRPMLDSMI